MRKLATEILKEGRHHCRGAGDVDNMWIALEGRRIGSLEKGEKRRRNWTTKIADEGNQGDRRKVHLFSSAADPFPTRRDHQDDTQTSILFTKSLQGMDFPSAYALIEEILRLF